MPLELTRPDPFNAGILYQSLIDAGLTPDWRDTLEPDVIEMLNLTEEDRDAAQAVFDAHPAAAAAEAERLELWADNEKSISAKMLAALDANTADIATNDAIIAQPSFTNVQITNAIKELARQSNRQARQINGIIRTLHRQFDEVE